MRTGLWAGARRWWGRLRRRFDPLLVDRLLAVLLTVLTQLAIWAGHDAEGHRLGAALAAAAMTLPIAVRRRYPFLVGTLVPTVGACGHGAWNPYSLGYPLAEFLALYGLAVWTPSRQFVAGTLVFTAAALGSSAVYRREPPVRGLVRESRPCW